VTCLLTEAIAYLKRRSGASKMYIKYLLLFHSRSYLSSRSNLLSARFPSSPRCRSFRYSLKSRDISTIDLRCVSVMTILPSESFVASYSAKATAVWNAGLLLAKSCCHLHPSHPPFRISLPFHLTDFSSLPSRYSFASMFNRM
jgi:hypothetical protein